MQKIIFALVLAGNFFFLNQTPLFADSLYWNPGGQFRLRFTNDSGFSNLSAKLSSGASNYLLKTAVDVKNPSNVILTFSYTNSSFLDGGLQLRLFTNQSAPFLVTNVTVDRVPPRLKVITNSPEIVLGGSAVAIVEASDDHLSRVFVGDSNGEKYDGVPFQKNGRFMILFAWPVYEKVSFFSVVASDLAGNSVTNQLEIKLIPRKYPVTRMKLSSSFSSERMNDMGLEVTNKNLSEIEKYNLMLQSYNTKREINIVELTSVPQTNFLASFDVNVFAPVTNIHVTSPFGEHRFMLLKRKVVQESYHLGVDLAKGKKVPITASNGGIVAYAGYLGGNGNVVILSHGAHLFSLYAHCSELYVKTGDAVSPGQLIARSGETGYAIGDHTHFSVLIEGRYVNPMEWVNSEWISNDIVNVLKAD